MPERITHNAPPRNSSTLKHGGSTKNVLLVLMVLLLVSRSFIYVSHREHEFIPSMFASLDTFTAGSDAHLEIPVPAQSGLERDTESTADPDPASLPPTGCLAMIIKNESPILPRLFESVGGFVSECCVLDTGY